MKNLTCCLIIFFHSFFAFSQSNTKLDSLKKVLAKLPKEGASFGGDTMRVRVLVEMGEVDKKALKQSIYFIQSIALSKRVGWIKGEILSYYSYGLLLSNNGKIFEAIDYYYKSLLLSEKMVDNNFIIKNYRSLGDAYWLSEDYKKAIEMFEKALSIINPNQNSKIYYLCLNNIGLVYYKTKEFAKAISIFNKCYLGAKQKNDSLSQSYYLGNIGAANRELGKIDDALLYLHKAELIENRISNLSNTDKAFAKIEIARAYYLKKDFKKALNYANNANKLNNGIDSYTQISIYKTLYEINKSMKSAKISLNYLEKYNELKNMSDKQDFDRRLKGLQFEYENQKQIADIEVLNNDIIQKELTERFLWIGLILIALFFFIQYRSNSLLKSKNIQIEKQRNDISELNQNLELKVDERTKELVIANQELLTKNEEIMSALVEGQTIERKRVAVELHDNLGSMLSGMKWRLQALNKDKLSEKEQKVYEGILTMMGDAYSEVRLISHNLLPAELEKSGLQGALQKLANDINQSEKLQISISFDINGGKIDKKTELEMYGICMEMVNNILKHSKATEVVISLERKDEKLELKIKDNGIGLDLSSSKNEGLGLNNIKKRLESINGIFNIISEPNKGTEIIIIC